MPSLKGIKTFFRQKQPQNPEEETHYVGVNMEDIPDNKVLMPTWMYNPPYGVARIMRNGEIFNAREMKLLGSSTTVWQCKKTITDAVVSCDWDILSTNSESPNTDKMKEIKTFLKNGARPSLPVQEGFTAIIFATMMDLLDLDAGAIVKVFAKRNPKRLVQLHSRDGSTFFKEADKYGTLLKYWQYDYKLIGNPVPLEQRDLAYLIMNPRSDSHYGEAPCESINLVVRGLVKGIKTQELVYRKGGIPSGIMGMEGLNKTEFDAFQEWWKTNMASQVYQRAMINAKVTWAPLITSFRDLQFLETQHWFTELVYRTFKVPHGDIGAGARSVKGELADEYRHFMKTTIKPYLNTIEHTINTQIIPHFYEDDEEPDCIFHYPMIDLLEEADELKNWEAKWKNGAGKINEYRKSKGLPPLPWGEFNPQALAQIMSYAQSWWYGALSDKTFEEATGMKGQPLSVLKMQQQTSKPPAQQQQKEAA